MTAAARYLARAVLRRSWRGAAALAVVFGVLWGVALGVAIGARRTATAYERMTTATKAVDLTVLPQLGNATSRLGPEAVRRLPGVIDFDVLEQFNTVIDESKAPSLETAVPVYAFREGAIPVRFERLALTSGRRPRPDRIEEAVVTPLFSKKYHLGDGDRFVLTVFDPRSFAIVAHQTMRIVGVGRMSDMVVKAQGLTFPTVLVGSAFYEKYRIYAAYNAQLLRLAPDTDIEAMKRRINALASGENIVFGTHTQRVSDVRRATGPSVAALIAFAAIVATAAWLGAAHVISRTIADRAGRQRMALAGIGATATDIAVSLTFGLFTWLAAAVVTAAAVATGLSGRFPVGVVRPIEVHPGLQFHRAGLTLGLVLPFTVTLLVCHRSSIREAHSRRRAYGFRRGQDGLRTARSIPWPLGRALAWSARRGGVLAGTATAAAFAAAALVVASSLHAFVSNPGRYGWRWDLSASLTPDIAIPDASQTAAGQQYAVRAEEFGSHLRNAPGLAGASLSRFGQAPVGRRRVVIPLVGFRRLHGDAIPAVLSGRMPRADGETAVGARIAHAENLGIGDRIPVGDGGSAASLRIVGIVAVPGLSFYPGSDAPQVGAVAMVTLEQFAKLQPPGSDLYALVRFAPSVRVADRHAVIEHVLGVKNDGERLGIEDGVRRNVDVVALEASQRTPLLLIATLTLLTLVLLGQTLAGEVLRRRRELAVLSVLGAAPATLRRLVSTYALLVVGIATTAGVVIGVVLGRRLWGMVTTNLGVAPGHVVPVRVLALAVTGALALGWVASWWPSRAIRRGRPAEVLRSP